VARCYPTLVAARRRVTSLSALHLTVADLHTISATSVDEGSDAASFLNRIRSQIEKKSDGQRPVAQGVVALSRDRAYHSRAV